MILDKEFLEFDVYDSKQQTKLILHKTTISGAKFYPAEGNCLLMTERGDFWILGTKEELLKKLGWIDEQT